MEIGLLLAPWIGRTAGQAQMAEAMGFSTLLLTDSQSVLPVRLADGNAVAFAEGRGDSMLRIRLINLGINPLKAGDVFVTSGAGGYYPPGIAVAIVAEKTEDGALARIISDPAATDYVAIEPIFQPQAIAAAATPVDESVEDTDAQADEE